MKETKHRSARWALGAWALVLAAAVALTGCGGAAAPAAPAGSGASASSAPGTASTVVQTAQKERITDQFALEKNVSGVWGEEEVQYISVHVPQLECDSPDAAYINDELNDIYAEHFREYEAYEEAGQPGSEYPQIGVGWDAYWYGDCVSLVVHDRYDTSSGRPCRPLTGRWRRAHITRAGVSTEIFRKCGWARWNAMKWKTFACFCRSKISW